MKRLLVILLLIGVSKIGLAQCKERITGRTIKPGMYIFGHAGEDIQKKYVAQILTVDGTSFTCRFLHSNSIYQFGNFKIKSPSSRSLMNATVQSNKGGGYKAGTVFTINVYMIDPDPCDLSTITSNSKNADNVIATFVADNKSYFGRIVKTPDGYYIYFPHSGAAYNTDNKFKVTKNEGGGYIVGSAMKIVHARLLDFDIFTP